jgi:hypothetical protein
MIRDFALSGVGTMQPAWRIQNVPAEQAIRALAVGRRNRLQTAGAGLKRLMGTA